MENRGMILILVVILAVAYFISARLSAKAKDPKEAKAFNRLRLASAAAIIGIAIAAIFGS